MDTIDCLGLACPAPVIKVKELIDKRSPDEFTVIVDNEAARQNVSRFLEFQNFSVSFVKDGDNFILTAGRSEKTGCGMCPHEAPTHERQKIMVMITSDCMGSGDDLLGSKLMAGFLKTLKEMGEDLWRVVFINGGVKLAVEGSSVLQPLMELKDQGVSIFSCGTCLMHFNLMEKLKVGEVTNMLDIVTSMQVADKVVSI
jgi:selenium metabolism protein YedF